MKINRFLKINICLIGLTLLFVIIFTSVKSKWLESTIVSKWLREFNTEALVYAIGSQNSYFTQALPQESEPPELSSIFIQLATNIRPGDIRSLFGNELPGFAIYDAEIYLASKGTSYATLPIESTPPIEEIMETAEPTEENKKILQENEDRHKNPTPKQNTKGKQVIHIYHSHSYEAYKPLSKNGTYNSSNPSTNIIAIGDVLKKDLEERGIGVSHDTSNIGETLKNKNWGTGKAYTAARENVVKTISNNKDIQYLIDMHRDSQPRHVTTIEIDGKTYARLFLVVGKEHPGYEKNLILAESLYNRINEKYPSLCRGVVIKGKNEGNGVYNQDLSTNSMLIEMGGIDNNLEELMNTSEAFADVFSEQYWDAEKVNATQENSE
ncbi:stage II sporulation protein P [Fictibacillus nanhaiensis]|uniref:stage II sporulation protein P n=1 Tax=Fictibacillus nanhaiensis TaxID=742169 RepID=UPI002E1F72A3|nr:stage II sporulation protein P [Fictibacillus nanhaiensis]